MAEYKSSYTGAQIDAGIGKANTALQPINYSTSEQNTGIKWIDGKDIYQRTFTGSTWNNNNEMSFDLTSATIGTVINLDGVSTTSTGIVVKMPRYVSNTTFTTLSYNGSTHYLVITRGSSNEASIIATIQYTKAAE